MFLSIGKPPAHIVDVDWRLDYYVKVSQGEREREGGGRERERERGEREREKERKRDGCSLNISLDQIYTTVNRTEVRKHRV